jgi:glucose-6-phosphate isomerase
VFDGVEVYADAGLLTDVTNLAGVLDAVLAAVPDRGYLAVMAYLDRVHDVPITAVRDLLAARLPHPVTFGWAPRFLHSTGQFHKGGPQEGAFLQITGAAVTDLDVPGKTFTLDRLQMAQALGDAEALTGRGRPFARLHLTDRAAGIAALLTAATLDIGS